MTSNVCPPGRRARGRPLKHAPPWWPENEAWPPPRRDIHWVRRRRRVMRRIAGLIVPMIVLIAIGGSTLVSWIVSLFDGSTGRPPLRPFSQPFLITLVMLFTMAVIAVLMMRRFGSPMSDIVATADRVGSGDYSARLIERGPPSLRQVARSFNSMTEQLQAQDHQRRQLMADIAHELRTPLSVLQGRLEGLLDGVYPRDDQRIAELLQDTRVLTRLVDDLRTLANAEAGNLPLQKEPTDLGILLQDAGAAFSAEAQEKGIALRIEEKQGEKQGEKQEEERELPLVEIDPLRIREVLTNLLANAIRHTGRGGSITVAAGIREGWVEVTVEDNGSGIPPEDLPRIFDRFYRGAASGGSGLGLTIARNLVVAHGGEIAAKSEVGRGTMTRFTLPFGAR